MPHADEAQLHAYLDREAEYADPNARKALGRHIADCSTCSALLKEVRQIHASSSKLLKVAHPSRRSAPSFEDVVRRANELRATASPGTDAPTADVEPVIEDAPTHDSADAIASQPVTWIEPDPVDHNVEETEIEEYEDEPQLETAAPHAYMYDNDVEEPVTHTPTVDAPARTSHESDSDIEFIEMSQPVETDDAEQVDAAEPTGDVVDGFESFEDTERQDDEPEQISDAGSRHQVAETPAEDEMDTQRAEDGVDESWSWIRRGTDDHFAAMPGDDTITGERGRTEDDEAHEAASDGFRISHDVSQEHDWMSNWTPAAPASDDTSDDVPDENEGAIDAPDLSLSHSLAAADAEEEIEVPVAPIPAVIPPPTAAQRRSSSAHRVPRRVKRKRGTRALALAATVIIAVGIGGWYARPYIMEQLNGRFGGLADSDQPADQVAAATEKSVNESQARTLADARGQDANTGAGRADNAPAARRSNASQESEARQLNRGAAAERDRASEPATPAASAAAPAPAPRLSQPSSANVGIVSGIVRETETNRPVSQAQVVVEGTGLSATTDQSGRYRLAQVPAGQNRISTRAIGFTSDTTVVALAPGREATIDVALKPSNVALDEVVVASSARAERFAAAGATADAGMTKESAADLLGGPLVIVADLPIVRIEESPAGGVRVTQRLESGATILLDIRQTGGAYVAGDRVENFRVMPSTGEETIASARFGSYLITARANVSTDMLAGLMRRLAQSPDSD